MVVAQGEGLTINGQHQAARRNGIPAHGGHDEQGAGGLAQQVYGGAGHYFGGRGGRAGPPQYQQQGLVVAHGLGHGIG